MRVTVVVLKITLRPMYKPENIIFYTYLSLKPYIILIIHINNYYNIYLLFKIYIIPFCEFMSTLGLYIELMLNLV